MNSFASGLQRFSITQGGADTKEVPCVDLINLAPILPTLLSQLESEVKDISDEAPLTHCLEKLLGAEKMSRTPLKKLKRSIEKVRKSLSLQLILLSKSRRLLRKGKDLEELLLSYLAQCNLGIHSSILMSTSRSKLLFGLPGKVEAILKKVTTFKSGLASLYMDNCSDNAFQSLLKEIQRLLDKGEHMEVDECPAGTSGQ
ncbi:hypothetical protein OJ252_3007 [Cryptosporidium canis]|uniref:Uncharacterized protein n=1 Tax=Cryptosporidium canis TaxID=195482 RepID=A0ABQ8P3L2_9CRYT|nr:hypothetical protein OJ252_3007 [Cryptosporidium canis]